MFAELKEALLHYGLSKFGRYYGVYQGVIVDNEDPEFVGRLTVTVPSVTGDSVSDWCHGRGMFCGTGIGLFAIPNKQDVVWVSFLEGDPRFPVWEYGWFGKGDVTDNIKNNGNKPTNMVWQSTTGHRIELDDKAGSEAVRVYSKHNHGMEINTNGVSVIAPTGKKIFLGGLNAAAEPAVLGDKNSTVLTDLQTIITTLNTMLTTVGSADAALATTFGLTYAATFAATSSALTTQLTALTAKIVATKSAKVKLD